ncbi:unnamed protein product [Brassicogethes aeneus]|uniref:Uncharacterized protein n=1 Tax=Brassicogethes aeneus TaxID=1431903 RepID=A0A9P0B0D4_BRAAE|nr:unnamed protein product [Brassicogethes aeneus]
MSVLIVTEKSKREVKELFNKNDESIKQDIEIIKNWIRQQKHLPGVEVFSDDFIERRLLDCKFIMEKTKSKIENYCSLRRLYSDLYENYANIKPSKLPM